MEAIPFHPRYWSSDDLAQGDAVQFLTCPDFPQLEGHIVTIDSDSMRYVVAAHANHGATLRRHYDDEGKTVEHRSDCHTLPKAVIS